MEFSYFSLKFRSDASTILLYMKLSTVCHIHFGRRLGLEINGPEIMIHTYVGHVDCLRHSVAL